MCLKLRSVNVDGIWVQDPRRGKTIRYVSTVRIGQIYTVCKYSTCVSAVRAVLRRKLLPGQEQMFPATPKDFLFLFCVVSKNHSINGG